VVASRDMATDGQLTRDAAACMLGISVRQLDRYGDEGLLTKYSNGSNRVRYCRQQVETLRRRRDQFVPAREAC
jgi:DNA-binding transcriptional MerR regulator